MMDFTNPFKMNERQLRESKAALESLVKKATDPARKRWFQQKLNEVDKELRKFK